MKIRSRGFTMIELITIMILVGILAAVAIPKLDSSAFRERGYRDGVFTALTHARRVAVASRRFVCVSVTSSKATVTRDEVKVSPESETAGAAINCADPVELPGATSTCDPNLNAVCAPTSVSSSVANVIFDPLGRSITSVNTLAADPITITITNQTSITVAAETGYVK